MSKDVIIAGAIAAGCVILVAVALIAPKSKPDDGDAGKLPDSALPAPGFDAAPGTGFSFGPATAGGFSAAPGTGSFPGADPAGTALLPPSTGFGPQAPLPALPATPAPVEAPPPIAAAAASEHTVAPGETLGDISLKYYKSSRDWKRIADANPGLDPRTLKVGQKLKIPAAEAAATAATAPLSAGPGERTYAIKAHDSLYGIAQRELGQASRWREIQGLNPGLNSNDLKIGQVIKLPAGGTGAAAAATTAGAPAPDAAEGRTHTVGKGETLSDISKKYFGTSRRWKDILAANPGLSPENLKVGQKIKLPAAAAGEPSPAPAGATAGAGDYTVKQGDTIRSIAAAQLGNGNDWKKIQDANPGINPRALRIGQTLKIPGRAAAPAVLPAPAPAPTPAAAQPFGAPAPFGSAPASGAPAPFAPAPLDAGGGAVPDFANPYAPAPADGGGLAPLDGPR